MTSAPTSTLTPTPLLLLEPPPPDPLVAQRQQQLDRLVQMCRRLDPHVHDTHLQTLMRRYGSDDTL